MAATRSRAQSPLAAAHRAERPVTGVPDIGDASDESDRESCRCIEARLGSVHCTRVWHSHGGRLAWAQLLPHMSGVPRNCLDEACTAAVVPAKSMGMMSATHEVSGV